MKQKFKQWGKIFFLRFWPSFYHRSVARRLRLMFRDKFFSYQSEVSVKLYGKSGKIHVLCGPFLGMKYFNEVFYSSATSRWLGTYEMELHCAIEEISQCGYRTIIDVGSAEGYYAVGLALRCPQAQIYACDVDPRSRDQCRRLSKINGVDERVHVKGLMRPKDFSALIVLPTLIVCDIEGYELSLLDPQICPAIQKCDLLVEVHESSEISKAVGSTLQARFAATHQIHILEVATRSISNVAYLFPDGSSDEDMQRAMEEHRPSSQQWLWMKRIAGE